MSRTESGAIEAERGISEELTGALRFLIPPLNGSQDGVWHALEFLSGHELAEFFRAVQEGAGVRVLRGPLAGVFAQAVQVIIRFARQLVLHAPRFFKNRIRFHASSLPSVPSEQVIRPRHGGNGEMHRIGAHGRGQGSGAEEFRREIFCLGGDGQHGQARE